MGKKNNGIWEKRVADKVCHLLPPDLLKLEGLYSLALDQRLSSSDYADTLWSKVAPEIWYKLRDPWLILQSITHKRMRELLADSEFLKIYQQQFDYQKEMTSAQGWFQKEHPRSAVKQIAYFSMEFGLSEALPIYSGGLGVLAGDHLKTACDLDVPIIGIGLLYQQGYFRQYFDLNGRQLEVYPYNDPNQLPIVRAQDPQGENITLAIEFPGRTIYFRAWEVRVGKIKLYLLDSNDAINTPLDRGITSSLYGGNIEQRLQQEIVLGIGGWKLLQILGIHPQVCHLNEGHAAFVVFARALSFMQENHVNFDTALSITRSGNIFTTHTPVSAGFDRFSPQLIAKYFESMCLPLGISINTLLGMGRENALDSDELFNMAYLAFRGSAAVNGVSKLHGEVSKRLFAPLFPRWPVEEVPIGHVTNGIHVPSWESPESDDLWAKASGKEQQWWLSVDKNSNDFSKINDAELWNFRFKAKQNLLAYVRSRLELQRRIRGKSTIEIAEAQHVFDPNALTIGFARRFATYKRADLLLHDQERLLRLVSDSKRPVQIIIAGKAHPYDEPAKAIIKEWIEFVQRADVRSHIVFLADYDILMAERLVQGVDVWLNTPRRPWEASGTSGMKLLVNGGLNLSELDGWWAEAYTPEVGWALGDAKEHDSDPNWDRTEADELYTILENQVVPMFYERDSRGIPVKWLQMIRNSMTKLTGQFSTNRMMRDYVEQYYLPAAESYTQRAKNRGVEGIKLHDWCQNLHDRWKTAQFVDMHVKNALGNKVFEVKVNLGTLTLDEVHVELYADANNGESPVHPQMNYVGKEEGSDGVYRFELQIDKALPDWQYTPRLVPSHLGVQVPIEANEILWQH